jgi:hypothetical protein
MTRQPRSDCLSAWLGRHVMLISGHASLWLTMNATVAGATRRLDPGNAQGGCGATRRGCEATATRAPPPACSDPPLLAKQDVGHSDCGWPSVRSVPHRPFAQLRMRVHATISSRACAQTPPRKLHASFLSRILFLSCTHAREYAHISTISLCCSCLCSSFNFVFFFFFFV